MSNQMNWPRDWKTGKGRFAIASDQFANGWLERPDFELSHSLSTVDVADPRWWRLLVKLTQAARNEFDATLRENYGGDIAAMFAAADQAGTVPSARGPYFVENRETIATELAKLSRPA
jgi:hypothetical protein